MPTNPSYASGYASPRRGQLVHPQLWRGVLGAWCPSLGNTGSVLFDQFTGEHDGSLSGFTITDAWADRRGLTFNGVNDFVDSGILWDAADKNFTVSAWCITTSTSGLIRIVANYPGTSPKDFFSLYVNNGTLTGFVRDSASQTISVTHGATVNDGKLHHVALVLEGTSLVLYLDGVAGTAGSNGSFNGDLTSGETIAIGRSSGTEASDYWDGVIDDVVLYNRALRSQEIRALTQLGQAGMYQKADHVFTVEQVASGLGIPIASYHQFHNVGSNL